MSNICGSAVAFCAARLTEVNAVGQVLAGALRAAVVQPVDLTVTWEYEDGINIVQRNGCGDVCVRHKTDRQLVGGTAQITFCELNPALEELIDGGNILTSGGNDIGYAGRAMNVDPPAGVGLEVWGIAKSGKQALTGYSNVRLGFPWVKNWTRGDIKLDGTSAWLPSWTGELEPNPNFANGPFNDWPENFVSEGLYAWHWINSIPTAQCELVTVPAQSGS